MELFYRLNLAYQTQLGTVLLALVALLGGLLCFYIFLVMLQRKKTKEAERRRRLQLKDDPKC